MPLIGKRMASDEAAKLPLAHEVPPHPDRAALDRAGTTARLTAYEKARAYARPHWHSYQHAACGEVTHLRYDDEVVGLAQNPRRPARARKGLWCASCKAMFPVGNNGEFYWVNTAGTVTQVKVGT